MHLLGCQPAQSRVEGDQQLTCVRRDELSPQVYPAVMLQAPAEQVTVKAFALCRNSSSSSSSSSTHDEDAETHTCLGDTKSSSSVEIVSDC